MYLHPVYDLKKETIMDAKKNEEGKVSNALIHQPHQNPYVCVFIQMVTTIVQ